MLGDSNNNTPVVDPSPPPSQVAIESGRGEDADGGRDPFDMEEGGSRGGGERSFGGNRWPRQETLALLKIRSDMDAAFKEASVKGPLWDEVSRKLSELGYNRNAKKCREKFENVFKYHKRTKEGRTGKSEGKTYRFFDQLEAFEPAHPQPLALPPPPPQPRQIPAMPPGNNPPATTSNTVTVSSSNKINFSIPGYLPQQIQQPQPQPASVPTFPAFSPDFISDDSSSSSSTSSDIEIQGRHRGKRKWKDYFERLMREVIQKQEDMQRRFLEAIEKREHERMAKEESWRMQEMARINRERETLAQEKSMSAAKDAAVMAFLQKISDQKNPPGEPHQFIIPPPLSQPQPPPALQQQLVVAKSDNNGDGSFLPASSSRWPKVEVEALISLRKNLDSKYQDTGPKGPLWEEISSGMKRLGYNRNAKRCKEKWENINKYFKKVKESNKKRPEGSKTCPYFDQLDALYKEKTTKSFDGSAPLLVQPEQQWPPLPPPQLDSNMDDNESEQDDNEDEEDEDEDEGAAGYEIVANSSSKPQP